MKKTVLKGLLIILILGSCKENTTTKNTQEEAKIISSEEVKPFFKLSLAQWSLHKAMISGEISPMDFAQKASELGFEGIEYVSQLYRDELKKNADPEKAMQEMLTILKANSEKYDVENLIIMVDREGNLSSTDVQERDTAIENHKKWVDAAQFLGCHSIRVNLSGTDDPDQWIDASAIGLGKLCDYAMTKNINVIVENHGGLSSNAGLLVKVMEKVNKSNCGTLPDFGNFCIRREDNKNWRTNCVEEYDKYQGVEEMMSYAKAVSAKSHDFDADGNESHIDYNKMLKIVKASGYKGFIGVEYEGAQLGEVEGIIATKDLLINTSKQLR